MGDTGESYLARSSGGLTVLPYESGGVKDKRSLPVGVAPVETNHDRLAGSEDASHHVQQSRYGAQREYGDARVPPVDQRRRTR